MDTQFVLKPADSVVIIEKIFYQEKDAKVDALADDLGSIELDMLMGEAGYYRINDNPLLWLPRE